MTIPGTHDSGTYTADGGESGSTFSQCQSWHLRDQLQAGIHFFDIRVRRTSNAFAIHHGIAFQYVMFGHLLNYASNFLYDNPRETVFMLVREATDAQEGSHSFDDILTRYERGWGRILRWSATNTDTLGQLRGKIVIFTNMWGYFGNRIEDHYDTTPDEKITYIRQALNNVNCGLGKHLTFTSSTRPYPQYAAWINNPRVHDFIKSKPRGTCLGFIAMDFPGANLVHDLIYRFNRN